MGACPLGSVQVHLMQRVTVAKSQYELDKQRRAKAPSRRPKGEKRPSRRGILIAVGAAAVAGLLIWAMVGSGGGVADNREENIAAFTLDDDPYMGDPAAPVVLVGYESPHCSSCQRFHQELLPALKAEQFDTGRAVYYYIQGTISNDFESNVAQECAMAEGGNDAFWALTDRFYSRSNTYSTPPLEGWLSDLAQQMDLDEEALLDCYRDRSTSRAVSQDWGVGRDRDATGTPTFWAFGPEGEAVRINDIRQIADVIDALAA